MIQNRELWERCVSFHGHACPGLAIGYRATETAIRELNLKFSKDEEIVCVTENDACGVDAIQVMTGCTFGKGNLIYRGTGKQAFSFFNRRTGDRLRIVFKSDHIGEDTDREARLKYILEAPSEELFDLKQPSFEPPKKARFFRSIVCEVCKESASEHKIRLHEGKKVCLDCFPDYSRGW